MKHARPDYNRIQDPDNIIPNDEPVFLIRAHDKCGPIIVHIWAFIAELLGTSSDMIFAARAQANAMFTWQDKHGSKIPDLPQSIPQNNPTNSER